MSDLVAWRELVTPRPEVLYWRTVNQEEVDFVIQSGPRLLPIEVKTIERPRHRDVRHLESFKAEYGNRVIGGLLLHAGSETAWLTREILAAPWWKVL